MKKIVFFTHYNTLNGANQSLLALLKHLQSIVLIHKVYIYGNQKTNEGLFEELISLNINVEKVNLKYYLYYSNKFYGFLSIPFKILNNIKIWSEIYTELKEESIDIVYSNSSLETTGLLMAKRLGTKHFWHIREFGYKDYKYRHIGGDFFKRYIFGKSDCLIAISKAIKDYIKNPSKTSLVHNGIFSISELNEMVLSKGQNKMLRLGMVGVIGQVKNQMQAIKAVKASIEEGQNVMLSIFGNVSDENYYKQLIHYIGKNKLDDRIEFKGFVKDKNIIYNEFDVLLMCSPSEAFGRVTIEAMAYEIPGVGF